MSRIYAIILCLATFVISADQWTKSLSLEYLPREGFSEPFLSWFSFTRVHNYAAAFGFFKSLPDGVREVFFILLPFVVLGLLWWFLVRHFKPHQILAPIATGLVLGGAIGNFIDRIRHGFVVDFIDWFYPSASGSCLPAFFYMPGSGCHWPVFNIADVAISTAIALFAYESFFMSPEEGSTTTKKKTAKAK